MCFSSGCVVGRGSDVGGVQVGAVDAPVRGEVLRCVALDVSLHGDQAAAELQAHGALVGRGAAVSSQVLDHGRVVPRALTTEATLEGLLPLRPREDREQGATGREAVVGGERCAHVREGLLPQRVINVFIPSALTLVNHKYSAIVIECNLSVKFN